MKSLFNPHLISLEANSSVLEQKMALQITTVRVPHHLNNDPDYRELMFTTKLGNSFQKHTLGDLIKNLTALTLWKVPHGISCANGI